MHPMATKQVASSRQQQHGHFGDSEEAGFDAQFSPCSCRVHAVDSRQGIVYTVETPDMFRIIASHHLHLPLPLPPLKKPVVIK